MKKSSSTNRCRSERLSRLPILSIMSKQTAVQELGISQEQLYGGGIKIYTTLDPHMQRAAEQAIADHLQLIRICRLRSSHWIRGTGHIKAMVGGRDYKVIN